MKQLDNLKESINDELDTAMETLQETRYLAPNSYGIGYKKGQIKAYKKILEVINDELDTAMETLQETRYLAPNSYGIGYKKGQIKAYKKILEVIEKMENE